MTEESNVVQEPKSLLRPKASNYSRSVSSIGTQTQFDALPLNSRQICRNPYANYFINEARANYRFKKSMPVTDIQVPLVINLPKLKDDGTSDIEQFYTKIQIHHGLQ
ncbi:hypothetical protein QAD02_006730 [Eretmocerus hayati]|uniref:Uncharacterized protein n=1 Tax=Eretmocerus hayati TaxID=131215 RepID=A0ACC2N255_9HYME|nr:hypothetical protein QAD02_006730 [Eretmocerus hayati]